MKAQWKIARLEFILASENGRDAWRTARCLRIYREGRRKRKESFDAILKRFENPDEKRLFEKGRFEVVRIGGMTIGRATCEPGWKLLGGIVAFRVRASGLDPRKEKQ